MANTKVYKYELIPTSNSRLDLINRQLWCNNKYYNDLRIVLNAKEGYKETRDMIPN